MYLKHRPTNDFVEVLDLKSLFDPCVDEINGRLHAGEEMQDPEVFKKADLVFPSDEALPQCWIDPDYKNA
jgi:hypothetical protein